MWMRKVSSYPEEDEEGALTFYRRNAYKSVIYSSKAMASSRLPPLPVCL